MQLFTRGNPKYQPALSKGMNSYLVSVSSPTIKNSSSKTPPNQTINRFFTSTEPITTHPYPPNMQSLEFNPPQILTKFCNRTQQQNLSLRSYSTIKHISYPSYKSQTENNKKEYRKVRTDGNQSIKPYAGIAKQSQCHQYKNNNNTKSPPETTNHLYPKNKKNTYKNRNHIIVSTGTKNNSSNQNNKFSSPSKKNIQQTHSTI